MTQAPGFSKSRTLLFASLALLVAGCGQQGAPQDPGNNPPSDGDGGNPGPQLQQAWLVQDAMAHALTEVAVDASGNTYVGGTFRDPADDNTMTYYDSYLAKYEPDGTLAWSKVLDRGADDRISDIVLGRDGKVYVSEQVSYGPVGVEYHLSRFDPDGNEVLTREINFFRRADEQPVTNFVVDAGGTVYAPVNTYGPGGAENTSPTIRVYDPAFNLERTIELQPDRVGDVNALTLDANGQLYATGELTAGQQPGKDCANTEAYVAQVNGGAGGTVWLKTFGDAQHPRSNPDEIVAHDAGLFVLWQTANDCGREATGTYLKRYDQAGQFGFHQPLADGATLAGASGERVLTVRQDGAGQQVAVRAASDGQLMAAHPLGLDGASPGEASLDPAGNLFVVGQQDDGKAFVARYDHE